ncbi:MAG: hypothetical protein ACKO9W_04325, partial [Bacteroidota bacterium]
EVDGIWFLADVEQAIQVTDEDGLWKWTKWSELRDKHMVDSPYQDGLEQGYFKAKSSKDLHGRLKGNAILRVPNPAYIPTEEDQKKAAQRSRGTGSLTLETLANRRGCMDPLFKPHQGLMNAARPLFSAAGVPMGDVVD